MKLQKLIIILVVLVALSASSGTYSALAEGPDPDPQVGILSITADCGPNAPGWTCNTSVTRVSNTTTCTATAISPGGSYNIYMYGLGPGGKALHVGSTYYGTAIPQSSPVHCSASSCTVVFTYTGSARPTLCNWGFYYTY